MTSKPENNHNLSKNEVDIDEYQNDKWHELRRFTQARIGLGRAGVSLPTHHQLQFNLDHAAARDAVHIPLNCETIVQELANHSLPHVRLHSRAQHRSEYLQRPDLGRRLNRASVETLTQYQSTQSTSSDVAIVLADGLSSVAVQSQGSELSRKLIESLTNHSLRVSPICIVEQGRVAIGDEIGELLQAKSVVLIVGERPGLSSPDSLGIYYTYAPKLGLTDANRNCISNIRPAGLSIDDAVARCCWLILEANKLGYSGVNLKDKSQESADNAAAINSPTGNFLLGN
ncbi:MAG: ethanolamine ammonia-lyase subunit EutC [Alteromonadaceae bacterium]|nr:ethanolamine ammonia-lyase subunit EutC [Alteromonadaceae bacterium]